MSERGGSMALGCAVYMLGALLAYALWTWVFG
jgi:hypothetical protein